MRRWQDNMEEEERATRGNGERESREHFLSAKTDLKHITSGLRPGWNSFSDFAKVKASELLIVVHIHVISCPISDYAAT